MYTIDFFLLIVSYFIKYVSNHMMIGSESILRICTLVTVIGARVTLT